MEQTIDIEKQANLTRMQVQLQGVFTPGAPVPRLSLLAGRLEEMRLALRAVSQQGTHAVLFGERGVGKTSIARFIHEMWSDIAKELTFLIPATISCDSSDDYQTIWEKIAVEIRITVDKRQIDSSTISDGGAFESALAELEVGNATPGEVRRALDLSGYRFIIVIDEFDRLSDTDTTRLMADTIKMLSDHLVDATLFVVGVADTLEELIEEHASIDRSVIQVLLARMSRSELEQIIDNGLGSVGMTIEPPAKQRIIALSKGLPHYTHLLSLHSALHAVGQEREDVQQSDIDGGLETALRGLEESMGKTYHQATSSPHKNARYTEVLLACALAESDQLGYFAPGDVREPIAVIKGEPQDIPSFMTHLRAFCSDKRGNVLQRSGEHTRPRYRFSNPLMKPYVVLRGLQERQDLQEVLGKFLGF